MNGLPPAFRTQGDHPPTGVDNLGAVAGAADPMDLVNPERLRTDPDKMLDEKIEFMSPYGIPGSLFQVPPAASLS